MDRPRDYQRESATDSVFHHWINQRQDERRQAGEPREHDLYEWMHAEQEMRRLPIWLKRAHEGTLATTHRQCSHSPTEQLPENRLICALGRDVLTCPILKSLYATFTNDLAHAERMHEKFDMPVRLQPDDAHVLGARCCTWHIFTMKTTTQPFLDTSEGYMQDESDRRFWGNVYSSLARADEEG